MTFGAAEMDWGNFFIRIDAGIFYFSDGRND
jgi:hypothetical protein